MSKKTIVGILQARMGSSRFPGKSLADINGEPLLQRIINIQKNTNLFDEYYVATSDLRIDNPIANLCSKMGIKCYRGSEKNVLYRFIDIAKITKADIIVRLTGDNPFVDSDLINLVLNNFLESEKKIIYASTEVESGFPFGMSVEVFLSSELYKYKNTKNKHILEHVTAEIRKKNNKEKHLLVESPFRCNKNINLSIDHKSDIDPIVSILKFLNNKSNYLDVLKRCNEIK